VTTGLHIVSDLADIGRTVARGGKKMEHGTIMPYTEGGNLEINLCDIRCEPADSL
jgi:hypothetical protein